MTYLKMADAAYASNIPPGFDIAAGYYGGPNAYHVWTVQDWGRFPGMKLPIWVGGSDGPGEGGQAVKMLGILGVPLGSVTVLDMETRVNKLYVEHFGAVLQASGYKVWVYGSEADDFADPQLNGYWVADYFPSTVNQTAEQQAEQLIAHHGVRAVQYEPGPLFDTSIVKPWTAGELWK